MITPLTMLLAVALLAAAVVDAKGEIRPSAELRFALALEADTVTVGDPILFRLFGAGPLTGDLHIPQFADSIGPFAILELSPPAWTETEDRREFVQEGRVALFESGVHETPRLPLLLLPGDGDTLIALSAPVQVIVQSVLPEDIDFSQPQEALGQLHEVKDVVRLQSNWAWAGGVAAILLAAALAFWIWKRRGREEEFVGTEERTVRRLEPEAAFRAGLQNLVEEQLLERGECKDYFAGLSMLLRGYLEGRFSIPAVEATRAELWPKIQSASALSELDRKKLRDWLTESDLVVFAKLAKDAEDAKEQTEVIEEWVAETTERQKKAESERAARALQAAEPNSPGPGPNDQDPLDVETGVNA